MDYIFWTILTLTVVFLFSASVTSFIEKEGRAATLLLAAGLIIVFFALFQSYLFPEKEFFKMIFIAVIILISMIFFLPLRSDPSKKELNYGRRFHEADAVLSRRRLQPGSPQYEAYYQVHPEYKDADDRTRENPGLLSERSKYYELASFTAAGVNFSLTEHLHIPGTQLSETEKKEINGKKMSGFIEKWLRSTGAEAVGFTKIREHHLYSHKGRGERAGEKIMNDLPHAVVITVEMDYHSMKHAPAGPTVMESSEQYLSSGILATKLALMIRGLGYSAKAHIDGNYEVICPLVAADAGMGVIGRMGLLMTPRLGPRVRIAVVTTDLPLEYQNKKADLSPLDFCRRCRKCAEVCPANAIPMGEKESIGGVSRWKIKSESCYNYWTIAGTDCGMCMISCPYAHVDNWFHRFIRWNIKNNLLFRIMAVKLDDVFYGRKPASRRLPEWHLIR